jgi:acyl dehydratase
MAEELNKALVGKSYPGGRHLVTKEAVLAFARATDDPDPLHPGEAPPVFPVVLLRELNDRVFQDPELHCDRKRLVHGEQALELKAPLRPGDEVTVTGTIQSIEEKPTGELLTLEARLEVSGERRVVSRAGAFLRGAGSLPKKGAGERQREKSQTGPPDHTGVVEIAADQAARYAEASRDRNPIHLDPAAARAAGLEGPILHGLCTLAMTARVLLEHAGGACRLKRLFARFSRPVYPPNRLSVEMWRKAGEDGTFDFSFLVKDRSGATVLTNGVASFGPDHGSPCSAP